MRSVIIEQHDFPIVHLMLFFEGGPIFDPPGLEGLTAITNRMLLRGTTKRDRRGLEDAVEDLGTELLIATRSYGLGVGAGLLARHLEPFVELLGEVLTAPAFVETELEKVKREMIADLDVALDEDGPLSRIWFRRCAFGDHPLSRGAMGTPQSLSAITIDDVIAHHHRQYAKRHLIVSASGDIDAADVEAMVRDRLAPLRDGEVHDWTLPPVARPHERRVTLIHRPERSQHQIVLGHPCVAAKHADVIPLGIATTAFGGTFTARLMQEVRVKRGWSYGAYARLAAERVGGLYMLTAAPDRGQAIGTLSLLFDELGRFVEEGLEDAEIEFAREHIMRAHVFATETASLQVAQRVGAMLLGRPADFADRYLERVAAPTPDEIRASVRRHLQPTALEVVMVCTADDALVAEVAAVPGVSEVRVRQPRDFLPRR
jgi:zinc protease